MAASRKAARKAWSTGQESNGSLSGIRHIPGYTVNDGEVHVYTERGSPGAADEHADRPREWRSSDGPSKAARTEPPVCTRFHLQFVGEGGFWACSLHKNRAALRQAFTGTGQAFCLTAIRQLFELQDGRL